MKFDVRIGEIEGAVEASRLDDEATSHITIGPQTHHVKLRALPPHQVHVTPVASEQAGTEAGEERAERFFAVRSEEGLWIWNAGRPRLVRDGERRRTGRGDASGVSPTVSPPMPAVVTKILVALGQSVDKGEALVVVSAMKMEMALSAPHGGTVAAIHTSEGAKVNPGEVLVEVEPEARDEPAEGAH